MKKIIINGANGYIASNFIYDLLTQNYEIVALARGGNNENAIQRMLKSLKEASNGKQVEVKNLKVYNYSLLDEDFSMSHKDLKDIFDGDVDYFHFAASLKYSKKSQHEIFQTNIMGVQNSIDVFLANATRKSRFFYVSTSYSCGRISNTFEEKYYEDDSIVAFRNYYEQSKRFAENLVHKHIKDNGLNAFVLRPSQVVGNSKTGMTKTNFGIFDFTKRVCNLAYRYPDKKVRIKADINSTQNLIPINIISTYLQKIIEIQNLPGIIHLVAKHPVRNKDIIDYLNEVLPIELIPCKQLEKSEMNPGERLIDIGMSFTGEYCNTNLAFGTRNLDKIITSENIEVTTEALRMMLANFIYNEMPGKASQKLKLVH